MILNNRWYKINDRILSPSEKMCTLWLETFGYVIFQPAHSNDAITVEVTPFAKYSVMVRRRNFNRLLEIPDETHDYLQEAYGDAVKKWKMLAGPKMPMEK